MPWFGSWDPLRFIFVNDKKLTFPLIPMLESVADIFNTGAKYVIPLLLCGIPFYGLVVKKVKVYEVFVDGAQEGFTIAVRIIPFLVAMLVAIAMFRASGMLDLLLATIPHPARINLLTIYCWA